MTQHNNPTVIKPAIQFADQTVQSIAYAGISTLLAVTSTATTTTNSSTQIVLISDYGDKMAYYNSTLSNWLYVGTDKPVITPPGPTSPPVTDYIAWYDPSSFSLGTSQWLDLSANGHHATINGSPTISANSGNGATGDFNQLVGVASSDSIVFPSGILPNTYSLFTVSRYSGSAKARIYTGNGGGTNWLSGHWNNITGVAYHNGWVVDPNDHGWGNNWIISADHNYFYRANGRTSDSGTGGGGASTSVLSVSGPVEGERSDWAVAECVVYNRNLNSTEISTMETYLATKYGITLG